MSKTKRNFYEILNATSNASFNQLKSNYKELILQCHPDKLQQQLEQLEIEKPNNLQINDDPNNSEFLAITEAWNCLKDPVTRKQYDAEQLLQKFHSHNNIYAHIKLSEMKKQTNTAEYYEEDQEVADLKESVKDEASKYLYTYDCRCGGQYIVDESAEQYCISVNNHDIQTNKSDNNGVHDGDGDGDDDADNKKFSGSTLQNDKNSPNIKQKTNNGGSSGASGSEGVAQGNDDDDYGGDDEEGVGELIVECSECSLVIILNG